MGRLIAVAFSTVVAGNPLVASTECAIDDLAEVVATAWKNETTVPDTPCYDDLLSSNDQAIEIHARVIELLDKDFDRIGYKVGFIGAADRERRGLDRPIFGVMYEGLVFEDGTIFDLDSIPRIQVEPDFLVRVGDAAINDAHTLVEAVPYLDRAYAFIELPAPLWESDYMGSGYMLQAMNGIPRYGVIGDFVSIGPDRNLVAEMAELKLYGYDQDGNELFHRDLSERPESPLDTVLEVVKRIRERGEALKAGDLISVGSLQPPNRSPQPGSTTRVEYQLGGDIIAATVNFAAGSGQ